MKKVFLLLIVCIFVTIDFIPVYSQTQEQIRGLAEVFSKAIMKVIDQLMTNLNGYYLKTYSTESFKKLTINGATKVEMNCQVSSWPPVNDSCMSNLFVDEDLIDGTLDSNDILEMQIGYDSKNIYFKLKAEGLIPGDNVEGWVNFFGVSMTKKDNNKTSNFFILFSPNYYSIFKMPSANLFKVSGSKVEPKNSNLEYITDGNVLYLKLPKESIEIVSKNKLYILMTTSIGGDNFYLKDHTQTIFYEF